MAQLAGLSYSSPFYQLLQGALGQAGFGTVQSFLLDEFWQQTMIWMDIETYISRMVC